MRRTKNTSWRALCGAAIMLLLCLLAGHALAAKQPWKWAITLRGTDPATRTMLPTALYIDEARSKYYVVDSGGGKLLSFDKEGQYVQAFDAEGALDKPYDMVRLSDGTLVVVEKGRNTLTRIDLKAKVTTPKALSHEGRQLYPDRLDMVGNKLYVLDKATGDIYRLNEQLAIESRLPAPAASRGIVDFRVEGNSIWALGQMDKRLYQLDAAGKVQTQLELGNSVLFPVSFTRDEAGNFYVLDRHAGTVVMYTGQGREVYRFLSKGQTQERLYYPNEIRLDPWGRLCVVDEGNSRVELYSR